MIKPTLKMSWQYDNATLYITWILANNLPDTTKMECIYDLKFTQDVRFSYNDTRLLQLIRTNKKWTEFPRTYRKIQAINLALTEVKYILLLHHTLLGKHLGFRENNWKHNNSTDFPYILFAQTVNTSERSRNSFSNITFIRFVIISNNTRKTQCLFIL